MRRLISGLRVAVLVPLLLIQGCGGKGNGSEPGLGDSDSGQVTDNQPDDQQNSTDGGDDSGQPPALLPGERGSLPLIVLSTDDAQPILDRENYIATAMTIANADDEQLYTGRAGMRGRGNTTWVFAPKKPYRLKLDSKSELLGMPSNKNWVLLANYFDKSLLRNHVAFEASRRLGLAWTPRDVPVELVLNGSYDGAYALVEHIRIDKKRVNITATDDVTPAAAEDGGYLLEVNDRMDDPVCWRTRLAVPLCLSEPDPSRADQQDYIKAYVQAAEDALFSNDPANTVSGYERYIDVDSLINWYLVNELFKNADSAFFSSVYLYKDAGGRLTFGPVWDFDISSGNVDASLGAGPQGFFTATASWIAQMKSADPAFNARVRARWDEIKPSIDALPAFIDTEAASLQAAQQRNFVRWPILDISVWTNTRVTGSYEGEVAYFRDWLVQRISWLDENL